MIRYLIFSLVLVASLWAAPAPLKDKDIRNFIAVLDELESMEGEFDELLPEEEDDDVTHTISSSLSHIKENPALYGRLVNLLQDHGFQTAEAWASIGDRIIHAWISLEIKEAGEESQQNIQAALAEIDANTALSEEQKVLMKQNISAMIGSIQQAQNAPEADVKAVAPYLDDLRKISESEE